MKATRLTNLAFQLNALMDENPADDLSIDEVKRQIEDDTFFEFLELRYQGKIDLSLLDESDRSELLNEWKDLVNAVSERRKFGVQNHGLSLAIAYIVEGLQRRVCDAAI